MKRISIIMMALLIATGLTQCKKNEQPNAANDENGKVYITLNVNQGNGSRLDVDPPHVTFASGDKILVVSNGVYVGSLEHDGTKFGGSISAATEGQPLYFYLLGGTVPEGLTEGSTTSCLASISDQTATKPVIACAPSNENYGTTNSFTATLRNKCALVKFSVTTSSTAATCIKGFNNKVTVSFAENTLTPSQEGEGIITLPAGNGDKWVILLPQDAMTAGAEGSAYSMDGKYEGSCGAVPAIVANGYLTTGIPVTVNTRMPQPGALNGLFSVSETKQVRFSKGNLQYFCSTSAPEWQFAEHQYDCVVFDGSAYSENSNKWIDLFGWATSGYNHGATAYQPWSTSTDYSYYYAYGSGTYNLYDQTGQADWGYNAISNGGNEMGSGWRTLTNAEWGYVFNTRTDAASKWGHGKVNEVIGMILLPDTWTLPEGLPSFTAGNSSWANVYTAEQWTQMEANGAVFLPAAGYRNGTSLNLNYGYYWSSSYPSSSQAHAHHVWFYSAYLNPQTYSYRFYGFSVRLVYDAE